MRLLLDECLPRKLRFDFPDLDVSTVSAQGWSSITNGQLLRRAARQFHVLITADQRLRYQQDLSRTFQVNTGSRFRSVFGRPPNCGLFAPARPG